MRTGERADVTGSHRPPEDRELAVIAGGHTRVGRAIARTFAADDWRVLVLGTPGPSLDMLGDVGCTIAPFEPSVDGSIPDTVEELERIDCLVTGPGRMTVGPIEETTDDDLSELIAENLLGPHRLIRAVLPTMRHAEAGRILLLASPAGRVGLPGWGPYGASMAAATTLADALRLEVAAHGIDVSVLEAWLPGDGTEAEDESTDDSTSKADEPVYPELDRLLADIATIGGIPTGETIDRVAEVALHAASCPDPAARYPIGSVARALGLARYVPPQIRDIGIRIGLRVIT